MQKLRKYGAAAMLLICAVAKMRHADAVQREDAYSTLGWTQEIDLFDPATGILTGATLSAQLDMQLEISLFPLETLSNVDFLISFSASVSSPAGDLFLTGQDTASRIDFEAGVRKSFPVSSRLQGNLPVGPIAALIGPGTGQLSASWPAVIQFEISVDPSQFDLQQSGYSGTVTSDVRLDYHFDPLPTHDFVWDNFGSSGIYSVASNWAPEGVPSAGDNAIFNLDNAYTVNFSANAETAVARVSSGDVTFRFDRNKYEVERVEVGGGDAPAALTVTNFTAPPIPEEHGLVAGELIVGRNGKLTDSDRMFVGNVDFPPFGPFNNQSLTDLQVKRSLRIEMGGEVHAIFAKVDGPAADDGTGIANATVTGVGSKWVTGVLQIGEQAAGRVDVTAGGQVLSPDVGAEALSVTVDSADLTTESQLNVSGVGAGGGLAVASTLLAADVTVGKEGIGRMTIEGGAKAGVDHLVVGDDVGSIGKVFIRGAGTKWEMANTLANSIVVGGAGRGELTISDGADVTAFLRVGVNGAVGPNDEGIVTVNGAGTRLHSADMQVGLAGVGELAITGGAEADATLVKVGTFLGCNGLIRVADPGSKLLVDLNMVLGGESTTTGFGSLLVSDAAEVTIRDDEGTFGFLNVGDTGIAEVASGGRLTASILTAIGEVLIHDSASKLTTTFGGTLSGGGALRVTDNATFEARSQTLNLFGVADLARGGKINAARAFVGGDLTVSGAGSALTADAALADGSGGEEGEIAPGVIGVAGELTASAGGLVVADRIQVGPTGRVDGHGGVIHVGTFDVADGGFFNEGLVAAGASPGVLTIEGDFANLETGVIEIEIAGPASGAQYDQLVVTGNAIVGGVVRFAFRDGFAPTKDDVFDFLTVTGETDLSGAMFEVRNLAPGFLFDIAPGAGGFTMVALNNGTFVPEPGALVLASLGFVGVSLIRRARPGRLVERQAALFRRPTT